MLQCYGHGITLFVISRLSPFRGPEDMEESSCKEGWPLPICTSPFYKVYQTFWAMSLAEKVEAKAWAAWVKLVVLETPAWPFPAAAETLKPLVEQTVVTTLIDLFRIADQQMNVSGLLKALHDEKEQLEPESFKQDVVDLYRVACASEASEEEMSEIIQVRDELLNSKRDPPSRWTKAVPFGCAE